MLSQISSTPGTTSTATTITTTKYLAKESTKAGRVKLKINEGLLELMKLIVWKSLIDNGNTRYLR